MRVFAAFVALTLAALGAHAEDHAPMTITHEPAVTTEPMRTTHLHIWRVRFTQDLFEYFRPIHDSEYKFRIDQRSLVTVTGQINSHIRDGSPTSMVSYTWFLDRNNDGIFDPSEREFPFSGGNILADPHQHYAMYPLTFNEVLDPGTYTLVLMGRSASTAAPGRNGLIEIREASSEYRLEIKSIPDGLTVTETVGDPAYEAHMRSRTPLSAADVGQ